MSSQKVAARIHPPVTLSPETKCSHCAGTKCCNYATQALDTPRSMDDFDLMLWQMAHKNVEIYKDKDGWFLLFNTPCHFLQVDGSCGIYATRPQLCRDYDNDFCEFDESAAEHFEFYFCSYDELDAYCRKRFKRWDKRFRL